MQGSTRGAEAVAKSAQSQALRVTRSKEAEVASRRGVEETKVLSVKTLTAEGEEPVKKHIEIQLPPGSMYRAGDYLAILPSNPRPSVLRALRRFDIRVSAFSLLPSVRCGVISY
jgi:cytochrome P450/NADPH-cytochrome P450 reductase